MEKTQVIVFSFPEPADNNPLALAVIIEKAKSIFDDMPKVKAHMAINDAANSIMETLSPDEESEGNLVKHARRELSRLKNDEDFNKSIISAVKAFSTYGHSGGSASYAIPLLNDLLQFKNLSPLTDDPSEWNNVSDASGEEVWQSNRCPEAFSSDGGKTYYLLSEGADQKNQKPLHISEKTK